MAFNDVVRHIILRILVDQAGLAAEMAKARAALKGLKDSEKADNAERVKGHDNVTKAIKAQKAALEENARAQEAARRARAGESSAHLDALNKETEAVTKEAAAVKGRIVEEAKADAIRSKATQDELDRIAARERAEKEFDKTVTGLTEGFAANERRLDEEAQQRREADDKAFIQIQAEKAAAAEAGQKRAQDAADGTEGREQKRFDNAETRSQKQYDRDQARAEATEQRKREAFKAEQEREKYRAEREAASFTASEQRKGFTGFQNAFNKQRKADREHAEYDSQASDNETRRGATFGARVYDDLDALRQAQRLRQERSNAAGHDTFRASNLAEQAAASAREAAERATSNADQRRVRNLREEQRLRDEITKASNAGRLAEERINEVVERRLRAMAREEEMAARRARRNQSIPGAVGNVLADAAVLAGRAVFSAPRAAARATRADPRTVDEQVRRSTTAMGRAEQAAEDLGRKLDSIPWFRTLAARAAAVFDGAENRGNRFYENLRRTTDNYATSSVRTWGDVGRKLKEVLRSDAGTQQANPFKLIAASLFDVNKAVRSSHAAFGNFFRSIPRGAEDAARGMSTLSAKVRAFFSELSRSRAGGSGNLFKDLINNFDVMGEKLANGFSQFGRHLLSFQSLIIAVIAALGPLAAVLGAVGAAALGVASNMVALVGSLYALPGILGALIGGFGALALVMQPLTNVFQLYNAAQKENTDGTNKAVVAANRLAEARKQAARKIEDYRDALKRLKYDEEGAALGAESAELAYRKSLVDPTATGLDRRIARHSYEGALYDQQDQAKNAKRTREDAAQAIGKGVDGADEVVAAMAATKTATQQYQEALDKLPPSTRKVVKAIVDLKEHFTDLRNSLSDSIFGPISTETGKFKTALDNLFAFLNPIGKAIGIFAKSALDLFTNPEWKKFFAEQGDESGKILGALGTAALSVAEGFRAITEIARPFTDFVVGGIKGMAKSFEDFTNSKDGRDQITHFLEITRKRIEELAPVVKNLVGGFVGFFKALNMGGKDDFTSWFNKGLLSGAKTFNELGKKAQDPNGGFQKWLKDVRPLLSDIVHFLSAAAGFFGKLFSDQRNINEARDILKEIADKWLPALADIFAKIAESGFISKLAGVITNLFHALQSLFDSGFLKGAVSGVATAFDTVSSALATVFGWVTKLTEKFPIFGDVVKNIGTIIGLVLGTALIAHLLKIDKAIKGIFSLVKGVGSVVSSIRSVDPDDDDPDKPRRKSRLRRFAQGRVDAFKDTVTGRDSGTAAARRTAREEQRAAARRGGVAAGSAPKVDLTNTGGVLPTLYRMEKDLRQIVANTGRTGGRGNGGSGTDDGPNGTKPRPDGGGPRPSSGSGSTHTGGTVTRRETDANWRQHPGPYNTPKSNLPYYPAQNWRYREGTGGESPFIQRPELGNTTARPGQAAPQRELEGRRGLPAGPAGPLALPQTPSIRPMPSPYSNQFPEGPARPPSRPTLGDAGRDLTVYPGLDQPYGVPKPGGTQRRGPGGRFLPTTPERPITSLPWVGQDDSPYYDPNQPTKTPRRPTQFPGGVRRPPARPQLPDAGVDYSPYAQPGLYDDYTVPKRSQRPRGPGGRFLPTAPQAPITSLPWVGRDDTPYYEGTTPPARPRPPVQTVPQAPLTRGSDGRFVPRPAPQAHPYTPLDLDEVTRPMPGRPARPIVPALPARPVVPTEPANGPRPTPTPTSTPIVNPRRQSSTVLDGEVIAPDRPVVSTPRREQSTIIDGDVVKPSRWSRIKNRVKGVLRDETGALGGDVLDDTPTTTTRRDRSTRPGGSTRPGRGRGRGRGGRRPSIRPDIGTGSALGAGEAYEEGYEDGLRAGSGGGQGLDLPDRDDDREGKRPSRKERRQQRRVARQARRGVPVADTLDDVLEGDVLTRDESNERIDRRSRSLAVDEPERAARRGVPGAQVERAGTRSRGLRNLFSRAGGARNAGRLSRLGGGLLRGAAGGVGGLVAGAAASLGGDYLINKYVKNDEDAGSLQRGIGAVANGAGIGAMIGSVIPGFGTAIGGAIGGLAGGAYSLFKDKNLRSFVGGKLQGGAKAVGGFVSGVGDKIGDFFTGGKGGGGPLGSLKGADGKLGAGGAIAAITGPLGLLLSKTDIGKSIIDSLDKAGGKIGAFFTKTIPGWWHSGVKAITDFFTKTLPSLPGKAFDAFFRGIGRIAAFFTKDLPHFAATAAKFLFDAFFRGVGRIAAFFIKDLPHYASVAVKFLVGKFMDFVKFWYVTLPAMVIEFFTKKLPALAAEGWQWMVQNLCVPLAKFVTEDIPKFFTDTIPHWFESAFHWYQEHVSLPIAKFITEDIPKFFTDTIPKWFAAAPGFFKSHVIEPLTDFFTKTLPDFFLHDVPDAIAKLPGFIYNNLVQPVLDFFKGIAGHIGDFLKGSWGWAKGLFNRASKDVQEGYDTPAKHMSGGLIQGVYQGIQDTAHIMATPGEFMVRKPRVDEPGAKAFLRDFNEKGMASLYSGLSASTAPQVMSMIPPEAKAMTGAVPTVVNNTVNHAPIMGDVTIHNPVRERSEHSLRRQVQIAAIRHRR